MCHRDTSLQLQLRWVHLHSRLYCALFCNDASTCLYMGSKAPPTEVTQPSCMQLQHQPHHQSLCSCGYGYVSLLA